MRCFPLIVAICLAGVSFAAQDKSGFIFSGEDIKIEILNSSSYRIKALYFFRKDLSSNNQLNVFYPIPSNSNLSFPLDFNCDAHGRSVQFSPDQKGKGFFITIGSGPMETCTLDVSYSQKSRNGEGRYILTSTAAWGRPLEWGEYHIEIPENIRLDSVSFKPDTIQIIGEKKIFTFRKTNFSPLKDICFRWNSPKRK
jgi:hypothetical protein